MGLILASCRFYCNEADTSAVDRDIINKRQLLADNTDIICNPNYIASTRIQQVATEALEIKKKRHLATLTYQGVDGRARSPGSKQDQHAWACQFRYCQSLCSYIRLKRALLSKIV